MWKKSESGVSPLQSIPAPRAQPAQPQQSPAPQAKKQALIGQTISIKGNLNF
jgi:hypothetical protein